MDPNGMMKRLMGGMMNTAERSSRSLMKMVRSPINGLPKGPVRDFFSLISNVDEEGETHQEAAPMPTVAMVAINSQTFPDESKIVQALRMVWPDGPEISQVTRDKTVLHFKLEGSTAVIGYVPTAIEPDELEPLFEMSWHWPEAQEVLQYHRAHYMVGLETRSEHRVAAAMALTKIVTAVVQASEDCVAVYWEAGPVVQPPELFVQCGQIMSSENLPLMLWVNFGLCPERDNKTTLVTSGMRSLGSKEIEVAQSPHPKDVLLNAAYGFAHYLLASGYQPQDGAVLGEAGSQMRLRILPSVIQKGQTVIRLEF
jgi:hypothetical protein